MIIARLINPRIIYKDGVRHAFENTLIYFDTEANQEIQRDDLNLPYEMPDPEIEELVKSKAMAKANELGIEQSLQESVEWDWPSEDL
jgi:hypothetical protein